MRCAFWFFSCVGLQYTVLKDTIVLIFIQTPADFFPELNSHVIHRGKTINTSVLLIYYFKSPFLILVYFFSFWDTSATELLLAPLWWSCLRVHTAFFFLIVRDMKWLIVLLQRLRSLPLNSFSVALNIKITLSKTISAFRKFFQSYFVSFCSVAVIYFFSSCEHQNSSSWTKVSRKYILKTCVRSHPKWKASCANFPINYSC